MKVKNSGNTDFFKNVFQIKFDILLTNNHALKGYIKREQTCVKYIHT